MHTIIKEFFRAFFIGLVIFFVLQTFQFLNGARYNHFTDLLEDFIYNQIYTLLLYLVNAIVVYYFLRRYREEVFKFPQIAQAIVANVGVTLVAMFAIRVTAKVLIGGISLMAFWQAETFSFYSTVFLISMCITAMFYGGYYYKYTQDRKVKTHKLLAGTASAQYDALKNQLDPHFLFNSLNVLTSLIEENPKAATQFTTALSKVYRYVLEQKNKNLVTLAEELDFAKQYVALLKMRFEDSIVCEMPSALKNPDAKVVPLSLQLLLENAVKHNQVTEKRPLHIAIVEDNETLKITNTLQPKQVVKSSSGVGLKNISQRYALLTDRQVIINKTKSNLFSVVLPMLTKQTQEMQTTEDFLHEKKYALAKKQVEEIKGFYIHLAIYLIMVPVFIYLNARSTDFPWAIFPIFGWGVGVISHAMETFNYNPFLGKDWENRKIKQFMDEDTHEKF